MSGGVQVHPAPQSQVSQVDASIAKVEKASNETRTEKAFSVPKYIGRGDSYVQSCKSKFLCGRRVQIQPECCLVTYDITFFLMFIVGWIITFIWNRKYVSNNPILAFFGNNNLCVGIDSLPARYLSVPLSAISIVFFFLTAILFLKRMWDQDMTRENEHGEVIVADKSKWFRGLLIISSLLVYLFSGLAVGMPPTRLGSNFKAHLIGFICGLAGYSLLKISSLVEFCYFRNQDPYGPRCNGCNNCRALAWLIVEVFHTVILTLFPFSLLGKTMKVYSMPDDVLAARVANITYEPTWQQQSGLWGYPPGLSFTLTLATFLCPFLALFLAPARRDLNIEFNYQGGFRYDAMDPTVADDDQIIDQVCCCTFRMNRSNFCLRTFGCCKRTPIPAWTIQVSDQKTPSSS